MGVDTKLPFFNRKTEVVGFSSGVMRFTLPELSQVAMGTLTNPTSLISSAHVVLECPVFSLLKLGKTLAGSSIAVLFLRFVILSFYACCYLSSTFNIAIECCTFCAFWFGVLADRTSWYPSPWLSCWLLFSVLCHCIGIHITKFTYFATHIPKNSVHLVY